jgi:flagellar hook assembly protein FlgD
MYHYYDTGVVPGREYRYYAEAVFALPYEGGTREYRSRSAVVGQTAMFDVVDIVSQLAPNPTAGTVNFSVAVPKSFRPTAFGQARVPTDIDVRVYNVRGQLVRTLRTGSVLDAALTMSWDGTYQDGTQAPSGVYFLRVEAGEEELVRKIVLLR